MIRRRRQTIALLRLKVRAASILSPVQRTGTHVGGRASLTIRPSTGKLRTYLAELALWESTQDFVRSRPYDTWGTAAIAVAEEEAGQVADDEDNDDEVILLQGL
jgi:hypothetical protein